jgi:hypothetical protein
MFRQHDGGSHEGIERLLDAGRPRAAFSCARYQIQKLDVQVIHRMLSDMAAGGSDRPGEYLLDYHDIEAAFRRLGGSDMVTVQQKAGLEFAFIDALARRWGSHSNSYGIPNLEQHIQEHPELFVQAIVWAYKRNDGGVDPTEFQVPADRVKHMGEKGYKLLEALSRIPGRDNLGVVSTDRLGQWIGAIRKSCAELGRAEVGDLCLGKLLAHAPIGEDGVWPCEPVRQVMEELQSDAMMRGAHTAVYNSRGVVSRGEGGGQERQLADKYRKWGQALGSSHPYVGSRLLMELVRTYEGEANLHDLETAISRRMR